MIDLMNAVIEAADYFEEKNIPYAIIGGIAVQYWGEPRTTRDVDVQIYLPEEKKEVVFRDILNHFSQRLSDAFQFALTARVLLIESSNGTPIDLTLAVPGFGDFVMARRVKAQIHPDYRPVFIISAEDLIVSKCFAGRPIDSQDVKHILKKNGNKLDLQYIRQWLADFAVFVEEFDINNFFEKIAAECELK